MCVFVIFFFLRVLNLLVCEYLAAAAQFKLQDIKICEYLAAAAQFKLQDINTPVEEED